MITSALRSLAAFTLAAPAVASTWIVDDNGGPGVDFTSISAAVAVAVPGDVILVRAGTYGGFSLSSGVRVLGDPGVQVTSQIAITNVPAGPRATIARMSTRTIVVSQCAASVTLEDIAVLANGGESPYAAAIAVVASADVRLRGVDVVVGGTFTAAADALRCDASRLEITHSRLQGSNGMDWPQGPVPSPTPGGNGMSVHGLSDVHVSLSSLLGGGGGHVDGEFFPPAANGGHGILVTSAQARLLVTGVPADVIRGGPGGTTPLPTCIQDGQAGNGIVLNGATARLSGATIAGALLNCGLPGASAPAVVGAYTSPIPADPSLAVTGTIAQGQQVTFTLRGAPGSAARLRLGRQPVVQDLVGVFEDRLTVPLRTYDLGTLPPSGQATFQILLSGALAPGFLLVAQASTTLPGETTLTQSVPISVR